MTRLLLVRHGQSRWNAEGRIQGQADPPLTALGEQQAADAVLRIEAQGPFAAVYASDLVRAHHTAEIVAACLSLPVTLDARLRERSWGEWEGLTRAEIDAGWPGDLDARRYPPGFETDPDVLVRARPALDAIVAAHDGAVLVVTHGGVVRTFERHLGADDAILPNLGGQWLVHDGDGLGLGDRVVLVDASELTRPREE